MLVCLPSALLCQFVCVCLCVWVCVCICVCLGFCVCVCVCVCVLVGALSHGSLWWLKLLIILGWKWSDCCTPLSFSGEVTWRQSRRRRRKTSSRLHTTGKDEFPRKHSDKAGENIMWADCSHGVFSGLLDGLVSWSYEPDHKVVYLLMGSSLRGRRSSQVEMGSVREAPVWHPTKVESKVYWIRGCKNRSLGRSIYWTNGQRQQWKTARKERVRGNSFHWACH